LFTELSLQREFSVSALKVKIALADMSLEWAGQVEIWLWSNDFCVFVSKDRGHIVFGLSVCLSAKTLTLVDIL
jgi:hypothetical protein